MSDARTIVSQAAQLAQSGRIADAKALLLRGVQQGKADKTMLQLLRQLLSRLGEREQALYYAERLVAMDPADPDGVNVLAAALLETGKFERAVETLEKAVAAHPAHLLNRGLLANQYARLGWFAECADLIKAGLELNPGEPRLSGVYASALLQLGRADEAVPILRQAVQAMPGDPNVLSLLASASNAAWTVDRKDLFAAHAAFGRVVAAALPPFREPFTQSMDPDRKLRVGFVGGDFRACAMSPMLEPLIENLDRKRFEPLIFSTTDYADAVTARFRSIASVFRVVQGRTVVDAARMMRDDRPDVLIDLAGHGPAGALPSLHLRVAPVQATYLGYPCTTGIGNIDYRITDAHSDPAGFEDISVEKLMRLDPYAFCFRPPTDLPALTTPASARREGGFGGITFAAFAPGQRLSDQLIRLWVKVLRAVPGSRILVRHPTLSDARGREQFARRFAVNGAPPERVLVEGPAGGEAFTLAARLEQYHRADIALDTYPYSGMASTVDALLMGVPVVTMAGRTPASRGAVAPLHAVGLGELIASSEDEYVARASALAGDAGRLAELRASVRGRLVGSALCDAAGFTRRFEAGLREAWRARCRG
jgi:protein O-GlcNAc transferase